MIVQKGVATATHTYRDHPLAGSGQDFAEAAHQQSLPTGLCFQSQDAQVIGGIHSEDRPRGRHMEGVGDEAVPRRIAARHEARNVDAGMSGENRVMARETDTTSRQPQDVGGVGLGYLVWAESVEDDEQEHRRGTFW